MAEIVRGDIVYLRTGSRPMKVLDVDRGVATVAMAGPDGRQLKKLLPCSTLVLKKRPNGRKMFVVVKERAAG